MEYRLAAYYWQNYRALLTDLIHKTKSQKVLDIGGGAYPLLFLDAIEANGLEYSILDISESELSKAPTGYRKINADICSDSLRLDGFDLAVTCMLAEHIVDAEKFHRNVFALLRPGGLAVHFFPTLYCLPFITNLILPKSLSRLLTYMLQPGRSTGKFPAYYKWCRGPTRKQIARFEGIGYEIREYVGLFGHSYYKNIPVLNRAVESIARFQLKHPMPLFTSYAFLVLHKPLK